MIRKLILVFVTALFMFNLLSAITVPTRDSWQLTIGSGNQTSRVPLDMFRQNSLFECIYLQSDLQTTGTINGVTFYSNFVSNLPNKPVKIWLGNTNQSNLTSGWIPSGQLELVFDGTVSFPSGQNSITINFSTPFNYTGANLAMMVNRPQDTQSYNAADNFYAQSAITSIALKAVSSSIVYDPANPPSGALLSGQYPKTTFSFSNQYVINDLKAVSITGEANLSIGIPSAFTVKIRNLGNSPQTNYTVKLMQGNEVEVASIAGETIATNQELLLNLSWTPTTAGDTYVYAKIVLTDDENLANNSTPPMNVYVRTHQATAPAIGSGTENDPYQIATLENLFWIADSSSRWGYHYLQTANIDASQTQTWYEGQGWPGIGTEANPFTGSYNGQGQIIEGLYINRPNEYLIGLFGRANGANIQNLGLTNVEITGYYYVGALIGHGINSTISYCYSSGNIIGTYWYHVHTGGLIGHNEGETGTISNSYSSCTVSAIGSLYNAGGLVGRNDGIIKYSHSLGNVTGQSNVGGLVGQNYGIIESCFSSGVITGNSHVGGLIGENNNLLINCFSTAIVLGSSEVGGFAGFNNSKITTCYSTGDVSGAFNVGGLIGSSNTNYSIVTNSFWDVETSGQTASAGGIGNTTLQMKTQNTFTDVRWNFSIFWNMDSITNDGYPYLREQTIIIPVTAAPAGSGTIADPYQIASLANLCWIAESSNRWGYHYIQTSDIDASDSWNWYEGQGWLPIGTESNPFTGSYNGQNKVINELYINREATDVLGLFGRINTSNIQSLSVLNVDLKGRHYLGALVGYATNSVISHCNSSGIIAGQHYVGGLMGCSESNGGSVSFSSSSCSVSGWDYVAGLLGINSSPVSYCHSSGSVSSWAHSGGLIGRNYSVLSSCFSNGNVISTSLYVGGLVGSNYGAISNCYSKGDVTGSSQVGGLVGANGAALKNCYSAGSVTGTSDVGGLVGLSDTNSIVTNSFWDIETSGQTASAGGLGKTSPQMKTQTTFTDVRWNFSIFWNMDSITNDGYPYLREQTIIIPVTAAPAGSGTIADPYQIANLENLCWIAESSSRWGYHYLQTADIDAANSWNWYEGQGWLSIGTDITNFTGSYSGLDHTIDRLFINRPSQYLIGLFGRTNGASIQNLGITNAVITGFYYVGALIGHGISSTISHCYSSGSVSATNGESYLGGLVGVMEGQNPVISFSNSTCNVTGGGYSGGFVGVNRGSISYCHSSGTVTGRHNSGGFSGVNDGNIRNSFSSGSVTGTESNVGGFVGATNGNSILNCYSVNSVTGTTEVGGFAGTNNSKITNCYSTGDVTGTSNVGGLVGFAYENGIVNSSFWDIESSGQSASAGGIGKTTPQMKTQATFTDVRWNFTIFWNMDSMTNDGYPFLREQTIIIPITAAPAGSGTIADPYQIANLENLCWIAESSSRWGYHYLQTADIDAANSWNWYEERGWQSIGTETIPFSGSYNGQEHSINGLYINRPNTTFIGLFGKVNASNLQNLELSNVDITGQYYVGALVGWGDNPIISHCYSTGSVTGVGNWSHTGGLIGFNAGQSASIYYSRSSCDVSGSYHDVGGLAGTNDGTISYCNSTGNVIGSDHVGGLVGNNRGVIRNSFSTGDASGSNSIGGFIGFNTSSIINCYSTGNVNGIENIGGFVGYNSYLITNSYSIGAVTGTLALGGFAGLSDASVTNCFWDVEKSGQTASAGGSGKTTPQMKTQATFTDAGWIFPSVWSIAVGTNEGYPYLVTFITAAFTANLTSGFTPLTVQFTDQSEPGSAELDSWLWNFGDGSTSTVQSPSHIYEIPGSYSVSLTVTNVQDSTSTLIRNNYITVLFNVPLANLVSSPTMNFGSVIVSNSSDFQPLIIRNSGGRNLEISNLHFVSSPLHFEYQNPLRNLIIAPGNQATILVRFSPQSVGALSDTLYIENNSSNLPVLKIKLMGTGLYVPPMPPAGVSILINDSNAVISWEEVTETINNTPIVPDYYFIYFNGSSDANGVYYFLGRSFTNHYTHYDVGLGADNMFYRVRAIKTYSREASDTILAKVRKGMTETEVSAILRQ